MSVEKMEYFKDYKKLKLQEEFLEKNFTSTIKGLKTADYDFIDHQIDYNKFNNDCNLRRAEILNVAKELKWLKTVLRDESDPLAIKNLDIIDCGSRLTRLSNNIELLKNETTLRLDELSKEEEALNSDLGDITRIIFTERVTPFSKIVNVDKKCLTRLEVNDEFTELVARTGHTQGWSDEDHALFLKIRKKCDSVPQLVNEVKKKRPHFTNEEIVNHEAWQKMYTELREKRKKDITEWRAKFNCRSERIENNKNDEKVRRKEMKPNSYENVINKKKIMIEEWKAEKARKSAMDEEQKMRLEKARIDEDKRKRETKRFETRMKLINYKAERAKSSRDEIGPNLHRTNRGESLRLIKSFREQDERFLKKRLSRLKVSEEINEKKMSKPRVHWRQEYSSTLFKPTKVWEERCKPTDMNSKNLFERVNYVKDIQRLSSAPAHDGKRIN